MASGVGVTTLGCLLPTLGSGKSVRRRRWRGVGGGDGLAEEGLIRWRGGRQSLARL